MNFKFLFLATLLCTAYVSAELSPVDKCIYQRVPELSPAGRTLALSLLTPGKMTNRILSEGRSLRSLYSEGRKTPIFTLAALAAAGSMFAKGVGVAATATMAAETGYQAGYHGARLW